MYEQEDLDAVMIATPDHTHAPPAAMAVRLLLPRHAASTPLLANLVELAAILAAIVLLLSLVLPAIARGRTQSRVEVSLSNLIALGVAHATYAADWNGRQFTNVVDDLSIYGSNENQAYAAFVRSPVAHAKITGIDASGQMEYGHLIYNLSSSPFASEELPSSSIRRMWLASPAAM